MTFTNKRFAIAHVVVDIAADNESLLEAITRWLNDFEVADRDDAPPTIDVVIYDVPIGSPIPYRVDERAEPMHESNEAKYYVDGGLWIVEGKRTGTSIVDRAKRTIIGYAYAPLLTASQWDLEDFLHPMLELMRQEGLYVCHSGAVSAGGFGLLLAGKSGQGKSTLSVHLMHHGFDFHSDDRTFLRRTAEGFELLGLYEPAKLFASNVAHLPEMKESASLSGAAGGRKNDVDVRRLYPERTRLSSPLKGLLFPQWAPEERSRVEPIPAGKALLELLPLTLVCFDPDTTKAQFQFLSELVRLPAGRIVLGGDRERWHAVASEFMSRAGERQHGREI